MPWSVLAVQFPHLGGPCFVPCAQGPLANVLAFQREASPTAKPLYRVSVVEREAA